MSNFIWNAGTNGFSASPVELLSTEMNSMAAMTSLTSSVGGSSGLFNQSNFGNALWGGMYFIFGGSVTMTTGDLLAGWFLGSEDGGTHLEATFSNVPLARVPDFRIPFLGQGYASGNRVWAYDKIAIPPWAFKVFLYSQFASAALPASGNQLWLGPIEETFA